MWDLQLTCMYCQATTATLFKDSGMVFTPDHFLDIKECSGITSISLYYALSFLWWNSGQVLNISKGLPATYLVSQHNFAKELYLTYILRHYQVAQTCCFTYLLLALALCEPNIQICWSHWKLPKPFLFLKDQDFIGLRKKKKPFIISQFLLNQFVS